MKRDDRFVAGRPLCSFVGGRKLCSLYKCAWASTLRLSTMFMLKFVYFCFCSEHGLVISRFVEKRSQHAWG